MSNNNANQNETGLVVAKNLIGSVLIPADFAALDNLIQSLGDRSANLTPDEKTAASQVITEWNEGVVARIEANASLAREVMSFLDGQNMGGGLMDRCVQLFHDALGDTSGYKEYQDALEEYYSVRASAPIDKPVDDAMTVAETDRLHLDNQAAQLSHTRKLNRAEFQVLKAAKNYIKNLRALPEVMDAYSKLKAYARKSTRMAAECRDKASRAKINIAISDTETRKLLHELLDFSKEV